MRVPIFTKLTLRTKLTTLISALFIIPLVISHLYIAKALRREYYQTSAQRAMEIASFIATDPQIIEEYRLSGRQVEDEAAPSAISAHSIRYLDMLQRVGNVTFITLMDMNSVRLYHPNRSQIGHKFAGGDEGPALRGESYISSARGTLGFSQRAFVPVRDADGNQLGAVSVGILSGAIDEYIARLYNPLQQMLLAALAIGIVFTIILTRSIKSILFGLEPSEVAMLLEERNAMLRSVTDGIFAVDAAGRITMVNDEAERILRKAGITASVLGRPLSEVMPRTPLESVIKSGESDIDTPVSLNGVPVLASHRPLIVSGVNVGILVTFRDMSELRKMAEEITDINRYAEALRSQSHEFMNRLHAILGLANTGTSEDIKRYVGGVIDMKSAEMGAISEHVLDAVLGGFLASKYSAAHERGVTIVFDMEGELPPVENRSAQHGLITILGNLIDNALDAVEDSPVKKITVSIFPGERVLDLGVADTGAGMIEENLSLIFSKGYSTKGKERGLGLWLVVRTVDELNGTITVDTAPGSGASFEISLPAEALWERGNA